jgi:hypothetical protein
LLVVLEEEGDVLGSRKGFEICLGGDRLSLIIRFGI